MNQVKRVLAIIALACVAVTLVAFVVVLVQGKLQEHFAWVMVPGCAFLTVGLVALAINWLQKLKAEAKREREQQQ